MNQAEYNKIKKMDYNNYCEYLQQKYGIANGNYMSASWNRNQKISRTNEGLVIHHKFEDHAILLSHKKQAMLNPYEWQTAKI